MLLIQCNSQDRSLNKKLNNIQKIAVFENTNSKTNTIELIIGFAIGSVNTSTGQFEVNNFWIRLSEDAIQGLKAQIL